MDGGEMEHVIEERHPAVDREHAANRPENVAPLPGLEDGHEAEREPERDEGERSEGGYFCTSMKDMKVRAAETWCVQRSGSP